VITSGIYDRRNGLSGVSLHGSNPEPPMSALGQKQTSRHLQPMSALPPKADIRRRYSDVRFVPKADVSNCSKTILYSIILSAVASDVDGISAGSGFLNVRLR